MNRIELVLRLESHDPGEQLFYNTAKGRIRKVAVSIRWKTPE